MAQPVDDLADQPRLPVATAPDHDAVGAGCVERRIDFLEGRDVAIDDDRDLDRRLDLVDKAPIGGPGKHLAAGAAVHSDHANAAGFGNVREAGRVALVIVPAGAHLQRHRQIDRLDRRFEDAGRLQFVAHQRRPGMAAHHLLDRATEIDVDQAGAAVGVEFGCLGHHRRLAAGELHCHRLLLGAALRHRQ